MAAAASVAVAARSTGAAPRLHTAAPASGAASSCAAAFAPSNTPTSACDAPPADRLYQNCWQADDGKTICKTVLLVCYLVIQSQEPK